MDFKSNASRGVPTVSRRQGFCVHDKWRRCAWHGCCAVSAMVPQVVQCIALSVWQRFSAMHQLTITLIKDWRDTGH